MGKESLSPGGMSSREDSIRHSEDDSAYAELANYQSQDDLLLYGAESQVLGLYDQLDELRLERAVLEAHQEISSVGDLQLDFDIETRLKAAENEYLEARAAHLLRNSVVQEIIITDPVLKAIHSRANATPPERLLHPLVDRRDLLGIAQTNLSTRLNSTFTALATVEAYNVEAMEKNRDLSQTLVELANRRKNQQVSAINGSNLSEQLEGLKEGSAIAKRRWRVMKSVVAAVIVGSGVDWARNDQLRPVVLDEED